MPLLLDFVAELFGGSSSDTGTAEVAEGKLGEAAASDSGPGADAKGELATIEAVSGKVSDRAEGGGSETSLEEVASPGAGATGKDVTVEAVAVEAVESPLGKPEEAKTAESPLASGALRRKTS